MNPKKIKDIAPIVSKKTEVNKQEVEDIGNFFFKTYLKTKLMDFSNITYEIPYLGVFNLKINNINKTKDLLTNLLYKKLESYEKDSFLYNNILENIEHLKNAKWEDIKKEKELLYLEKLKQYEQNKKHLG
jgi:hypothetical protein